MHYQLTNQRWAIACILNFSFQETFPQNPKSIFKILCSERTYLSLIGSFQESCILNFSFGKTFLRIQPSPFSKYFSQNLKKCALSVDQSEWSNSTPFSRIMYTDSFFLIKLFSESNQVHFQNTFPFLERKYVLTPLIADWLISKIKYTDSFFFWENFPRIQPSPFSKYFPRIKKSVHYRLTNQRWAIACILNFSFQKVRTYRWLVHFKNQVYWLFLFW